MSFRSYKQNKTGRAMFGEAVSQGMRQNGKVIPQKKFNGKSILSRETGAMHSPQHWRLLKQGMQDTIDRMTALTSLTYSVNAADNAQDLWLAAPVDDGAFNYFGIGGKSSFLYYSASAAGAGVLPATRAGASGSFTGDGAVDIVIDRENSRAFLIPKNATQFRYVDLADTTGGTVTAFGPDVSLTADSSTNFFVGALIVGRKIYCSPGSYQGVAVVDMDDLSVTRLPYPNMAALTSKCGGRPIMGPDYNLYFIPWGDNEWFSLDIRNNSFTTLLSGTVGNVVLGGIMALDDNIYLAPHNNVYVAQINTSTGVVTPQFYTATGGAFAYSGFQLGLDGKLYSGSTAAANILVYDYVGGTHGTLAAGDGCTPYLGPDGAIMLLPNSNASGTRRLYGSINPLYQNASGINFQWEWGQVPIEYILSPFNLSGQTCYPYY